jgi:hypothetical protein
VTDLAASPISAPASTAAPTAPAPPAGAAAFGRRLIPPGDPLSGATFDAIWEAKVRPELMGLEAARQRAVMIFVIALIGGALMAWAEYLFAPALVHGRSGGIDMRLPLATLAGVGVLGYAPLAALARTAKADVVQALCRPMAVAYQVTGKEGPGYDDFMRLRMLPSHTAEKFEDFFSGQRGGVGFDLYEARLTRSAGRSTQIVFQGQLLRLATPRRLLGTTVVLRDASGFLAGNSPPPGLAKVGLEDVAFEHTFEVYGSDQVEAREVLTPAFMQHLMDADAQRGWKLRCAFVGSDLLVAVETGNRFEIGSMFSSLVDETRMASIARDIEQVFKLIDAFEGA